MSDMTVTVGSVRLPNPVMTASGTAGHGAELASYVDLARLGAVVVKSLSAEPWEGNPPPRVHQTDGGMLNSVGLQNPGVEAWIEQELPSLVATGARVVASIWGFTVEAYAKAAELADCPPEVVAVEVNLSCPNLGGGHVMFARGGLSGPAIRPVAVRAVYECRRAFPDAPVVGVGGIATGEQAAELLVAGANAVQVGTATFADPRATSRILEELQYWCDAHGVERVSDLIGSVHGTA